MDNPRSLKSHFLTKDQPNNGLGKLPPMAVDLEEAILGAIMLERESCNEALEIMRAEYFYKEQHKSIFEAVLNLIADSQPVDLMTVTAYLRKAAKLEFVGGAYYLTELTSKINSAANIESHCRLVMEMYLRRESIKAASNMQTLSYDDTEDIFKTMDSVEMELYKLRDSLQSKKTETIRQITSEGLSDLYARIKAKKEGRVMGVPFGWASLDRLTGGWQNTDLIIIAARPSMGKTAWAISGMKNAAMVFKIPVAFFSMEMGKKQLWNRLISSETEIENEKIVRGDLTEWEAEKVTQLSANLASAPIYIDDTPALSIMELRSKARRLKQKNGVGLIIVDYLQLMKGDSKGNREQEIASISRGLKIIAKELEIPVIALSQLSRAVEQRGGDKRPMLSDLRESGSIEQDADVVGFLYRPEYYGITQYEFGGSTAGMAETIFAKNRNGAIDTVTLRFIGKFAKYTEVESSNDVGKVYPKEVTPTEKEIEYQKIATNGLSNFESGKNLNRGENGWINPPEEDKAPF
jgi:replicative DNA helicase